MNRKGGLKTSFGHTFNMASSSLTKNVLYNVTIQDSTSVVCGIFCSEILNRTTYLCGRWKATI